MAHQLCWEACLRPASMLPLVGVVTAVLLVFKVGARRFDRNRGINLRQIRPVKPKHFGASPTKTKHFRASPGKTDAFGCFARFYRAEPQNAWVYWVYAIRKASWKYASD